MYQCAYFVAVNSVANKTQRKCFISYLSKIVSPSSNLVTTTSKTGKVLPFYKLPFKFDIAFNVFESA